MKSGPLDDLKVVLINLDRSTSRRATMEIRLAELGLRFERMPAFDGVGRFEELVSTVDVKAFERNVGRRLLPGEIGCYHSHLAAWRLLLESKARTLLVLEDDVVFGPDFMSALRIALDEADQWDFLKLNKIRAKQPVTQAWLGPYALNAYIGPATGLGAYLIKRDLVSRLLPRMLPITRPIDHELDRIHVHRFRHFGLEPFPSHVDDGNQSTITGRAFADVKKFPWYRRFAVYGLRLSNLTHRIIYLCGTGRLFKKSRRT
jgi:glycosyl transferase family 25